MRDEDVHSGGDRAARGPESPTPQFAPGPQVILTAAKEPAAAASEAASAADAAPERQSEGTAPSAPGPLSRTRTLSPVARQWLLFGGGAVAALLFVGVGALIAVRLVVVSDVGPSSRARAHDGGVRRRS